MRTQSPSDEPNTPCRAGWVLTAVGLALLCGACSREPAPLSGSLAALMDLMYSRAEVDLTPTSAALRFLTPQGTGENTVLKVSMILAGTELAAGKSLDLAEAPPGMDGARGKLTRNVLDDPHTTFPEIARGQFMMREDPATATHVTGDFSVTLAAGSEFGAGRTVYGDFDAEVVR